ncbi:alanyl-tRNA synthetase [Stanieria cyanosphaera PCC 7437]|uniref:Alanine--tRNA ligase n=1 Tax=Stanieria cyanosphaera (strain ATCC 29371 / PCC 7437) TaxID=111780 RepID=K9XPK0_STAC7|nr:alanine--tRNA ligase [Stanieria cyanosphaera]AFZ33981.1 alanyl-tRNA synthetase [Stanieria cyanosphaera PCC 7437]
MADSLQYFSGSDIRDKFLKFFEEKQHKILPSASLVPEDPTVLLTIAGMLPFKPIFLGQQKAPQPRATTSQKCIRTNDIENVGRTARHHTFFEMLGNFSFGDYFKEQAIQWAWELSTEVFGLPPERIVVSVFEEDDEAFAIWRDRIGIPAHRIQRMGEDDNFWVSGPTGPCGPCSELYYDFHPELGDKKIDLEDDTRFIEFYNLVFMQYNRDVDGNLTPLQNKNIDTGMGLERMAQILQKVPNNYETDLILPIIKTAAEIAGVDYTKADQTTKTSFKVIGDHVRAVVHMIADGITASNTDRGYVLRRLIRRVIRHGRLIGIEGNFINQVAETAISLSESAYPNVRKREQSIKNELQREENQFLKTLERGEKLLAEILAKKPQQISGVDAFTLYDTYGFPLELTQEIAEEQGLTVDVEGFNAEMEQQRDRAREAHQTIDLTVQGSIDQLAEHIHSTQFLGYKQLQVTAKVEALLVEGKSVEKAEAGTEVQIILDQTPFYAESGGQIGDKGYLSGDNLLIRIEDVQKESGFFVHYGKIERGTLAVNDTVNATIDRACRRRLQANHTATHLLQAALRKVVDDSISQAGSLVDFDRLRFDFHCPRALKAEEIQQVEDLVNSWISEAHEADVNIMPLEEAKAKGAIAMFGEKYDSEVRVIDFPGVSMELCGGTHVHNTAEIGIFKIISETGISSGIRRIEAVAGASVLDYLNVRDKVVKELSDRFKAKPEEISDRVNNLQAELKATQKELEAAKQELAVAKSDGLLSQAESVGEFKILVANMGDMDAKSLQAAAERLQQKLGESAVVLASIPEAGKVSLVAAFSQKIIKEKQLQAGKFIGVIAKICGGGGGGRPNLAQAGGRDASKLGEALDTAKQQLIEGLK